MSGPRVLSTEDIHPIPGTARGDGGTPAVDPQKEIETPVLEMDPAILPAALVQAMPTQVTARLLERMESDEFTHRLAKHLDTQEADHELVNKVFRSVLTPDRSRLEDQSDYESESMRNTSHRAIRSMQTVLKGVPMLGGPNGRPLGVIGVLRRFKAAAERALVNEGLALEILPFFVDERVRGTLREASPMQGMPVTATLMDYHGIFKKLLSSYLSEDKCEDHYWALRTATSQAWEDN